MNVRKLKPKIVPNQNRDVELLVDDRPDVMPPDIELSDEDIKRIAEGHKKLGIDD